MPSTRTPELHITFVRNFRSVISMENSENEVSPCGAEETPPVTEIKSNLRPEAPPFVPRGYTETVPVVAAPSAEEYYSNIIHACSYEPLIHFHRLRADNPAYQRWGVTTEAYPIDLRCEARNVYKMWRLVPITAPTSLIDSVYITSCKEKLCDLYTWSPIKLEYFIYYYTGSCCDLKHKKTTDGICHTCHNEWQIYESKCEAIKMLVNGDLTILVNNNYGATPLIDSTAQEDYSEEANDYTNVSNNANASPADIEMQSINRTVIQNNGFIYIFEDKIPEVSAYGLYPNTPPYERRTLYNDHYSEELYNNIIKTTSQDNSDNELELEIMNFFNQTTDDSSENMMTIEHCKFWPQLPKDAYFRPISPVGRQPGNQNDQPLVLNNNILIHRKPLCDISNTSDSPPACVLGFTHQPRTPGGEMPRSFVDYEPSTQPDLNITPPQVTYNAGPQLEVWPFLHHFIDYTEESYNKYTRKG